MTALVLRGTVVSGGREIPDGVVVVDGDRISSVGPAASYAGDLPPATQQYVLPGLVDVHCHGAAGHGFPDADVEGVHTAVDHHLAHGTTTLLGSLVSAPATTLLQRVRTLAPLVGHGLLAGIHLEGPFLAAARCGAQDPAAIVPGDPALLERLLDAADGAVASMTLAPETPHYRELLTVLARHGALPSLGHTDATATRTTEAIAEAVAGGATPSATHLFNGMPELHHRAPGPVAACLAAAGRGEMVLELIADGVHLADETVAMVFDLVGPDRIALVTDAMAAAGMPDGRYALGSMGVEVVDRVARLAGPGGPIAGGTTRLVDVLRRVVRMVGLGAAVLAATATPARLLGLDHEVGDLAVGLRADVLVTDRDLNPLAVLRAGRAIRGMAVR